MRNKRREGDPHLAHSITLSRNRGGGALNQRQVFRACYGLLVVTALKLLWDGTSGLFA